ncbi:MAG: S-layer homology domain-containing protein [Ruminococcaceae bacterium]|nr:S-layer homology domain-containing protein [Oscillospiraceae bacterium]
MKKNTHVCRLLALLISVLMLLSMMPMTALAAKEMFISKELTTVSLQGVTAPKARTTPDMTAGTVRSDRYKVIDVYWTPTISYGNRIIKIGADEFFDFNTGYMVHIILEAVGDYYFKLNADNTSAVTAKINGDLTATAVLPSQEYRNLGDNKRLEVYYAFPTTAASLTVNHVDLTIDPPVAGKKAQEMDMHFSDEMIGKVIYMRQNGLSVSWFHGTEEMKPTDTFVLGDQYMALVKLKTYVDGVKFAVDTSHLLVGLPNTTVTATVNGQKATAVTPNNQDGNATTHIVVGMLFTCGNKQQIQNVDISDIEAPIAGSSADYEAALGAKTYKMQEKNNTAVKNGIYWTVTDDASQSLRDVLIADSVFDEYTNYAITIKVVPQNENYEFASDAKVTLNGIPVSARIEKDMVTVSYIFPKTAAIPVQSIDSVSISGVDLTPKDPEKPLNGKEKISNDQVTIAEFLWDTVARSNWKPGIADVVLHAADGYVFTEDTVVKINGYYAKNFSITDEGRVAVYRCIFAPVFKEDPAMHTHAGEWEHTLFEHWMLCPCGDNYNFDNHTMNASNECTVCGFKIYDVAALPFTDVKADDYFAQAVAWAFEDGITAGTSATTFEPDATCTRSQVVTFLWRAAGCPEPKSMNNPFTDVKSSDWFFKPVLWAVEQNITQGTSATTFTPDRDCSTAEILTFLFRSVGAGSNGYYEEAAEWAEYLDLLKDTGLEVNPTTPCPRKAIVSFLYGIYG